MSWRTVKDWIRVILPPSWVIATFVALYLFVHLPQVVYVLYGGRWEEAPRASDARCVLTLLAATIYGIYRVSAFHPGLRAEYCKWLLTTPWHSGLPLPMGPVHLVWQDAALLLMLFVLGLPQSLKYFPLYPLLLLVGYAIWAMLMLAISRLPRYAFVLAVGLGLVLYLFHIPFVALAISVALYPVAYFGLQRSLEFLPRNAEGQQSTELLRLAATKDTVGFPFVALRPEAEPAGIGALAGLAIGCLAAWWAFVFNAKMIDPFGYGMYDVPVFDAARRGASTFVFIAAIVLAGGRAYNYCAGFAPPISLSGRLFTLRWIIPAYDQVFVAPIAIAAVAYFFRHLQGHLPMSLAVGLATGIMVFIHQCAGPRRHIWQLTCPCRISPFEYKSNKKTYLEI